MAEAYTVVNGEVRKVLEGQQQSFQSTGKPESKKPAKKSANKNPGIPKVRAEVVDEAGLKAKKQKEEQAHALAIKSLDKLTESIRHEVDGVSKAFCKIGFFLWKIRESKLYEERGFKNVYEFGEAVLNFKKSSTGNYINVCERFSKRDAKGKPTRELMDDYKSFSYTQLTEVLALPEGKEKDVKPEMTIKEIRKLKKAAEQAAEPAKPESLAESAALSTNDKKVCPPICIWDRVVTHKNLDALIASIKAQGFGKSFSIYVEQDDLPESANASKSPEGGAASNA